MAKGRTSKEGKAMIRMVKQLLHVTATSTQLAERLMETVEEEVWRQQFIRYLEDAKRQYQLWQYIHYLLAGTYEESDREEAVHAFFSELLHRLCLQEWKKAMLCHKAREGLSGAAQKASDHVLQQAMQYSRLFFMMAQTQLVPQIER
jgi:hypothetical protein